jgi:hypothetical protein
MIPRPVLICKKFIKYYVLRIRLFVRFGVGSFELGETGLMAVRAG